MGQVPRSRPRNLAGKLLQIREALDLSQNGMIRHLHLTGSVSQNGISAFELGTREPPLPILLRYARAAGVCVDILIDDELHLPEKIPSTPTHRGTPRHRSRGKPRKRG
jgi:transcriptional regulator with XRE-family HTH domain